MKKIFAFALAAAAAMSVQAQDAKTLYNEAKKLDDTFNKSKPTQTAPNKQITEEAALALLQAMEMYDQVAVLDNQPNEKGEVKPKFIKKIQDSREKHAKGNDFNQAAIVLYNANKKFPEAYTAFMLNGNTSKEYKTAADTVYAIDFYNAGNMAYGVDFKAAAKAYEAARAANIKDVNAYIYDIGSRQQMAQKDPEYAKQAGEDIFVIAGEGLKRFGPEQDFLLNNYIQHFIDNEKYDEAFGVLDQIAAQYPNNANVYRLRGIMSNATHKYKDAIPAFTKMADLTNRADYLTRAADDLNRIGKMVMGNLGNNVAPDQKAEVLDILNAAMSIANKAKTAEDADLNQINDVIEQIQYSINNANLL